MLSVFSTGGDDGCLPTTTADERIQASITDVSMIAQLETHPGVREAKAERTKSGWVLNGVVSMPTIDAMVSYGRRPVLHSFKGLKEAFSS